MKKLVLALLVSGVCLSAVAAPVPAEYDYASATGSCSDPSYVEDATGSFVKYAPGSASMSVCNTDDNQCWDVALHDNAFSMRDGTDSMQGTITMTDNNSHLLMHTVDKFLPFAKSKLLKKKALAPLALNGGQPITCTYDTLYIKK